MISEASLEQMPAVRDLFIEYQQWLGIDLCFQGFDQELAALPGCYAPPRGAVLLATHRNRLSGCVAFRALSETQAELKRLYVKPECRGAGLGRALFNAAMDRVRALGYQSIVLDTLPGMNTAQCMYRTYGFIEVPPYNTSPVEGVQYYRFEFSD